MRTYGMQTLVWRRPACIPSPQQAVHAPAPFCMHLPSSRLSTRRLRSVSIFLPARCSRACSVFSGARFLHLRCAFFCAFFALFRSCRPRSLFALCVFFARFCIVSLFPDPFDLLDDLAVFWVYPAFSGWSRVVRSRPHWGLNPGHSVYRTDALPLSYRA